MSDFGPIEQWRVDDFRDFPSEPQLDSPLRQPGALRNHKGQVTAVAYSADGSILVTGGVTGPVAMSGMTCLWDPTDGNLIRTVGPFNQYVTDVVISTDGESIASVGSLELYFDGLPVSGLSVKEVKKDRPWERRIRLWNVSDGVSLGELTGHEDVVTSIAFSPPARISPPPASTRPCASGTWSRSNW